MRAKFYGDGQWYAGVVLAQMGKGFYTVLFDGYEEDGPQVPACHLPSVTSRVECVMAFARHCAVGRGWIGWGCCWWWQRREG